MKRYISLGLAAAVLVFSLAVPSYAAENAWINVLDYSTPNDSGSNTVVLRSGDTVHFDFPASQVGYIDLVVQLEVPGTPTCAVAHEIDTNLVRIKLNDYVYRFYGELDLFLSEGIDLVFNNLPGGAVQFLSMKISPSVYMSYNTQMSGFVAYANGEEKNIYFNSSDDFGGATLPGTFDFLYDDYTAYLNFYDWKKYDYIDVQFYASYLSIDSIAASLAEVSVPFEISYLFGDNALNTYLVNLTLDLTEVNRDPSLPLELIITGNVPSMDSTIGYFAVLYCNGLLENSVPDETLSFWYRIKTFFTDRFAALNAWIDNQTSSVTGTIAQWGQNIVDAINPDTGAADDALEEGSQAADQVTDLTGQMNSIVKPDLSGGGDISSIISPGDMSSYTVFLSTVVNAPYIGQVVMLSLILSLAGYVLFGKR